MKKKKEQELIVKNQKDTLIVIILFSVLLILTGTGLIIYGFQQIGQLKKEADYQEIQAVIIRSDYRTYFSESRSGGRLFYQVQGVYEYQPGSVKYQSDFKIQSAFKIPEHKYKPGAQITVYYHTENPQESVTMKMNHYFRQYFYIILGGILICISMLAIFLNIRESMKIIRSLHPD
jgi:hypothetical protein